VLGQGDLLLDEGQQCARASDEDIRTSIRRDGTHSMLSGNRIQFNILNRELFAHLDRVKQSPEHYEALYHRRHHR
jgi:hypothetical protein